MPLTYTETHHISNVTKETKTLTAPKNWGMFTSIGNKSLEKKAQTLIAKLEKAKKREQQISALLAFLRSYRRMNKTKTMGEAGDTDVREQVWDFFQKACKCVSLHNSADDLWEER